MSQRRPGDPLRRPSAQLVAEAEARVRAIGVEEAAALLDDPAVAFVDVRDPREIAREGMIPGALKGPRGLLDFWVDPQSPYYNSRFDDGRALVLYCSLGWRSVLTAQTLLDMGRDDVAHLAGGFTAWRAAGHPVEGG